MKKTKFYALLFFLSVAMSGCDNEYDDTGIRTQIAEVTDQVKALQTLTEALQNRDYILSVVPTTVEGVPGYLITFAQAEPVTILCGTSVIAAVDTSHGDYVVFTLADDHYTAPKQCRHHRTRRLRCIILYRFQPGYPIAVSRYLEIR